MSFLIAQLRSCKNEASKEKKKRRRRRRTGKRDSGRREQGRGSDLSEEEISGKEAKVAPVRKEKEMKIQDNHAARPSHY